MHALAQMFAYYQLTYYSISLLIFKIFIYLLLEMVKSTNKMYVYSIIYSLVSLLLYLFFGLN